MNTANSTPGFNAEASLYRATGQYYTAVFDHTNGTNQQVLMQLLKVPRPGTFCNWETGQCIECDPTGTCRPLGGGSGGCDVSDQVQCAGALIACGWACATTGYAGCLGCLAGLGQGSCIKCWSGGSSSKLF